MRSMASVLAWAGAAMLFAAPVPSGSSHRFTQILIREKEPCSAITFSPDGRVLAIAGETTIRLCSVATRNFLSTWKLSSPTRCLAFSPDGKSLVSGHRNGSISRWDRETGRKLASCKAHADQVNAVTWSPDGTKLLTGGSLQVRVWSASLARCLTTYREEFNFVTSVAVSPDGRRVAWGGISGSVKRSDLSLRTIVCTYAREEVIEQPSIFMVRFSPDGTTIGWSGSEGLLGLWRSGHKQPLLELTGHTGAVRCFAFTPDGKWLVSGGADRCIHVWDVVTGRKLRLLRGHTGKIIALAVHPWGRLVASSDSDGTVRLWNLASASE